MASKLKDLDVTADELERFQKAFQDEQFRKMFAEYAEELSNPENRRRYEEEIRQMEREKGMDARFIYPHPGYVLLTSANGTQKCYLNICSNSSVPKPQGVPGTDGKARGGHHWTLPYTITPAREEMEKGGSKYLLYDIVFHPDTLAIATKNEKFKEMVDSTAMDAVTKNYQQQLDRTNVQTLSLKYKGVPQSGVVRKPIPGFTPTPEDPNDPLCFPYPYPPHSREDTGEAPSGQEKPTVQPVPRGDGSTKPHEEATTPHYTIRHRSYVDFQDYTYSRYSAPSPVPKELVVTVDLPLLSSAAGVNLHILSKQLDLDCKQPSYKLQASLPYPVDEKQGKAQFNKATKQLVITLPVIQQSVMSIMQDHIRTDDGEDQPNAQEEYEVQQHESCEYSQSASESGFHNPVCSQAGPSQNSLSQVVPNGYGTMTETLPRFCQQHETLTSNPHSLIMPPDTILSPTFTCTQDATSLTLIVHVKEIDEKSICSNVEMNQFQISFRVKHQYVCYFLLIQFLPKYSLNTNEISVNVSEHNAVIELTKSSENFGIWKNFYFGDNVNPLQERRFVTEDNVTEFLENNNQAAQVPWSTLEDELLLDVLELNDQTARIRINKPELAGEEPAEQLEPGTETKHSTSTANDASSPAVENDELQVLQQPSDESHVNTGGQTVGSEPLSDPAESACEPAVANGHAVEADSVENETPDLKETVKEKQDGAECPLSTSSNQSSQTPALKEISPKDGHVEVITDHTTQCAFTFQNPLLYDLD
ncbi:protein kintoun isoform X2 [Spea bombifrons]|uniref:protein kintoun isoform X2 n=1 Tax=Spea bombifrons TaxID=233779 RepID=UPI002349C04E|nr:protein kintoun isoform X2 [Spea bombifrons]